MKARLVCNLYFVFDGLERWKRKKSGITWYQLVSRGIWLILEGFEEVLVVQLTTTFCRMRRRRSTFPTATLNQMLSTTGQHGGVPGDKPYSVRRTL